MIKKKQPSRCLPFFFFSSSQQAKLWRELRHNPNDKWELYGCSHRGLSVQGHTGRIFQGNRPKLLQVVTLSKWCSALKEEHMRSVEPLWEKRKKKGLLIFSADADRYIRMWLWKKSRPLVTLSPRAVIQGSVIIKLGATVDIIESVHTQPSCETPFCAGWKDAARCGGELSPWISFSRRSQITMIGFYASSCLASV